MTTPQKWTAEGRRIRYDPTPGGRANEDGSRTYSLTFHALEVLPIVDDPERAAQEIAVSLNAYEAMSGAVREIAAERRRQIEEEGWSPEHDDRHAEGQLAAAAACYAWAGWPMWPWDRAFWKPKSRRRDLVRAGALILAEIERLDRAETKGAED